MQAASRAFRRALPTSRPSVRRYGGLGVESMGGRGGLDAMAMRGSLNNGLPCLSYWLGPALYLSVTNKCNTVPLHTTRGPGFRMPQPCDFKPLPDDYEPNAMEVITHLEGALSASHASLGRVWQEVVFAGWGEPTLRWETVCDVAEEIRRKHKNVKLRLSTNGLGTVAAGRCIAQEAAELFHGVTVALNTANPGQYEHIMRPDLQVRGEVAPSRVLGGVGFAHTPSTHAHGLVTEFVQDCVRSGAKTEVTAVARPDVDMAAVKQLARELGADFRSRAYFE